MGDIDIKKKFELIAGVIAKVKKNHKGESWTGVVKCPVCNKSLRVSIA